MNDHRAALKKNLFDLPTGWSWHWLTDVISIQGGTQPPANTFSSVPLPGYVRLVQIRDFETDAHVTFIPDSKKWRKCGEEDILIARYGAALGRICKGLSGAYNVALAKVVPSNSVDSGFIYQLLRSSFFQDPVLAMGGRSAQAGFNKDGLSVIPVPIPPLPEQRAIAATLGALDDKIELNRKMNATLEAMARALFRDWFVDFGPTRAKMEGRKPYLSPELWSLFPDRLDGEGKPEGWEVFRLEEIARLHTGSLKPTDTPAEVFEHFSLPAFDKGQQPALDAGETIRSNKTVVPAQSVLLSKLNPEIARIWLPQDARGLRQIASTEFLAFTAQPGFSRCLLFCLFSDANFRAVLQSMTTGTSKSHQRIRPRDLMTREVLAGSPDTFAAFHCVISPVLQRVRTNHAESRTLAQTRDLLLPRLMSGELRVAEAERIASEVA